MRITSNMYFNNIYANNSSNLNSALFDVNKQMASGVKIQYAYDDIRIFTDTMRLDNEITTLNQNKNSATSALKFSDQSDVVLNEFEDAFGRAKVLLLKAANGTNSDESREAIAKELRGIQSNLMNLANTSINGQYLFAGSNVSTRPIDANGNYMGNDVKMEALIGANSKQAYNISGAQLFLGEEKSTQKEITTNVLNQNVIAKYPDLAAPSDKGGALSASSTIRELMGDLDDDSTNGSGHFFYISGIKSNGESFKDKISLNDTDTVGQLLDHIGTLFGNSLGLEVVEVKLNDAGEIVIKDKTRGSSKLDFHMVGAVDFNGGSSADVSDINDLSLGERNFDDIKSGASTNHLYVKEFIKSDNTKLDGYIYDQAAFSVNGAKVSSNASQIVKNGNAFATDSTKLIDVASGSTLNGKSFTLDGVDINGNAFNVSINLGAAPTGSTFSLDGGVTNYNIYNAKTPRSPANADDVTYRQLMDVVNMVTTNNLPASTNSATDYDTAVASSLNQGSTNLSYDGKIEFKQNGVSSTKAQLSLYDSNSGDFSVGAAPSSMVFNSNTSMVLKDPKTDFFKTIEDIINAVENFSQYPDSTNTDPRSIGIQNAIGALDVLQDHLLKSHSTVGAQSNALQVSIKRSTLMVASTTSLRSDVIDTDMAEAYLKLSQLDQNFQAMLSTVGKVSKLSLVNYL